MVFINAMFSKNECLYSYMSNTIVKFFSRALPVLALVTCFTFGVHAQQPQTPQQPKTTVPTIDPSTVTPEQVKEIMDKAQDQQDQQSDVKDDQKKKDPSEGDADSKKEQDDKDKKDKKDVEKNKKDNKGGVGQAGLPIFGNDIFNHGSSTFAPDANRPIPMNYVVGPGDRLGISVTGLSVVNFSPTVGPDGAITLREFGKVYIGGKTLENATTTIKEKLRANHFAVDRGTDVDVTITNIRTIRISILGQVQTPGDYNVSSLTTVFNALYESGGITGNGTYRAIKVIRNNEVIANIDMYNYLLRGDMSDNISLRDGDIIQVKEYNVRVSMEGEVKRPAYYEVLPGETLKDVIGFAGGFTDYAYKFSIKAIQLTDRQQRIKDIKKNEFEDYVPLKGDRYVVSRILNKIENRVSIVGSVTRAGDYELEDGLTLKGLIAKADGLKEDAYLERGYITRQKEDNSSETIPFFIKGIMDGSEQDIPLRKEDVVQISSIFDYVDAYTVSINGSVRAGGTFPFYSGMTVEDLILRSGGFADGANMMEVEIARRVKDSDRGAKDAKLAQLMRVRIDKDLRVAESKFKLEPFDIVSVFALPGYVKAQMVKVEGEVMNPGTYAMLSKSDKISDVIKRANGFTAYAYLKGASLKRQELIQSQSDAEQQAFKIQQFQERQKVSTDGSVAADVYNPTKRNDFVGIDLAAIIKNPDNKSNLILLDGDVINVPRQLQTVKVSGEVYSPKTIVFTDHLSLSEYVNRSGGFTEKALKKNAYVVYANGDNKGTKHFLFFKNYPNVAPGAEIFIPEKKPKRTTNGAALAQTWIGISTSIVSMAALIFAVINNNN
jgi:protein involved in polysaccharide export with SLBB domain